MKPVERLIRKLKKDLPQFDWSDSVISPARGWWRSSREADCYRWEVYAAGPRFFGSYQTVTECLKRDYRLYADDGEIFASLRPLVVVPNKTPSP